MKRIAAVLVCLAAGTLAALAPAKAQVYGGDDDPYSQNPFASNFTVPDATLSQSQDHPNADQKAEAGTPGSPQPDGSKAEQATASGSNAAAQKPAQP